MDQVQYDGGVISRSGPRLKARAEWVDGVSWTTMAAAWAAIGAGGWGLVTAVSAASPAHGLVTVAALGAYLAYCRFVPLVRNRAIAITEAGRLYFPKGTPGRFGAYETAYSVSEVASVEYAAWSEWNTPATPEAGKAKEGLYEVYLMMTDGSRLVVSRQWNREGASRIVAQVTGLLRGRGTGYVRSM